MALEHQKPTLQQDISKIIWNICPSFQSKTKCPPFAIHFSRKPNTIWKQLSSNNLSDVILDKAKSILSKGQALDWKSDDRLDDGYRVIMIPKKPVPIGGRVRVGYPSPSKPSSYRLPLQSPFKSKILRKTKGSITGNLFYKELNQKIISASKTAIELSDEKIIKKSDISLPKSNSSTTRSFRRNICFPLLPNLDFDVGSKKTTKSKPQPLRKAGPKTRMKTELATYDNNTTTRVSNPSTKPTKSRPTRNKEQTSNEGYSACDESMIIELDTSGIRDWEWIAF